VDQTPQLADLPGVPRPGALDRLPHWVRSEHSRYPSETSRYWPGSPWNNWPPWTGCPLHQPCPQPGSLQSGGNL